MEQSACRKSANRRTDGFSSLLLLLLLLFTNTVQLQIYIVERYTWSVYTTCVYIYSVMPCVFELDCVCEVCMHATCMPHACHVHVTCI